MKNLIALLYFRLARVEILEQSVAPPSPGSPFLMLQKPFLGENLDPKTLSGILSEHWPVQSLCHYRAPCHAFCLGFAIVTSESLNMLSLDK